MWIFAIGPFLVPLINLLTKWGSVERAPILRFATRYILVLNLSAQLQRQVGILKICILLYYLLYFSESEYHGWGCACWSVHLCAHVTKAGM